MSLDISFNSDKLQFFLGPVGVGALGLKTFEEEENPGDLFLTSVERSKCQMWRWWINCHRKSFPRLS